MGRREATLYIPPG